MMGTNVYAMMAKLCNCCHKNARAHRPKCSRDYVAYYRPLIVNSSRGDLFAVAGTLRFANIEMSTLI